VCVCVRERERRVKSLFALPSFLTRYEMSAEWNILVVSHNHRMTVISISVFRQICLFGVELFPAAGQMKLTVPLYNCFTRKK